MRTLRLTKVSCLLAATLATSMASAPALAGPGGMNNSKQAPAVPLAALLDVSASAAPGNDDPASNTAAAALGLDPEAVKGALEAWNNEKHSPGANLYVSVDRKKKKVKVDAVGQVHIHSSFNGLLRLAPKGYAIEIAGNGIRYHLAGQTELMAGSKVTITGGNFMVMDDASVTMTDSSFTVGGGGSIIFSDNASLTLTDSTFTVSGGSMSLRPTATVVVVDSELSFAGAEVRGGSLVIAESSAALSQSSTVTVGKDVPAAKPAAKPATHATLESAGRIVLSNSKLTSTTGFTWAPTSRVVFDGKAELVGVGSLPGGKAPGDVTCGESGTCVSYDKRRNKYRSKSGTITVDVSQSTGNEVAPPAAGSSWATHLAAPVSKSVSK